MPTDQEMHPREKICTQAATDLANMLLAWRKKWSMSLTSAEVIALMHRLIAETITATLKYAVMAERKVPGAEVKRA